VSATAGEQEDDGGFDGRLGGGVQAFGVGGSQGAGGIGGVGGDQEGALGEAVAADEEGEGDIGEREVRMVLEVGGEGGGGVSEGGGGAGGE
jgi:hypothetical protein